MTSPRTILSAIAVAAALLGGCAPAAHAGTTDPSDAVGTASPEPTAAETDDPVEPTDEPTVDPDPTSEPSVEPTPVAPTTAPTTTVVTPQPTSTSTPAPTSTSTTTTTGTSTTGTSTTSVTPAPTSSTTAPVFYEHCNAVHDAGQPFLFAWEPGYRTELDRDLDGIACEWRERPDGSSGDPEPVDNDWRVLVVTIPVTVNNSSYTYYGDDDLDATYTQWPTVPDGPIATGQA